MPVEDVGEGFFVVGFRCLDQIVAFERFGVGLFEEESVGGFPFACAEGFVDALDDGGEFFFFVFGGPGAGGLGEGGLAFLVFDEVEFFLLDLLKAVVFEREIVAEFDVGFALGSRR